MEPIQKPFFEIFVGRARPSFEVNPFLHRLLDNDDIQEFKYEASFDYFAQFFIILRNISINGRFSKRRQDIVQLGWIILKREFQQSRVVTICFQKRRKKPHQVVGDWSKEASLPVNQDTFQSLTLHVLKINFNLSKHEVVWFCVSMAQS